MLFLQQLQKKFKQYYTLQDVTDKAIIDTKECKPADFFQNRNCRF